MSDLKPNVQEDKDVESVSGSRGPTQEPLQSHTSSPKNNAAGLSSDEHENPLNGAQPNPFVYSGVPAVPHAGNSLPSGALVNGPGSHPTSEVHCVLNKGSILSNNVLDTVWQPEKDTRPQVLPPPSELQSDAWNNTAGLVLKTLPTQPGANAPLSDSEETESKLPYSTLSGDSSDQKHISQPLISTAMKTRSLQDLDTELSTSSSDDYGDPEVIRWDSTKELKTSSRNGLAVNSRPEKKTRALPRLTSQRKRKHSAQAADVAGYRERVTLQSSLYYTNKQFRAGNDVDIANTHVSLGSKSDFKYSVDTQQLINSAAAKSPNEENDPEDEDSASAKPEAPGTEQSERGPPFFPCTICNVNFQKERHLHRHMMYHLDGHNQVNHESVSQPFICRECGRLFCDSNSLMRHIIIHQERLEKLMEEIKSLQKLENEDGDAGSQCPRCAFRCNCPKTLGQRSKTHENAEHYHCCEECNYITLTEQGLGAHLHAAHLDSHRPKHWRASHADGGEEPDSPQFRRTSHSFTDRDRRASERRSEREQAESFYDDCEKAVLNRASERKDPTVNRLKVANRLKTADSKSLRFNSSLGYEPPAPCADLTYWSGKNSDVYMKNSHQKKSCKSLNSSKFKCNVGCTTNELSPSLWKIDKHGKLSLLPVEKIDMTAGLCYAEKGSQHYDRKVPGNSEQTNCPSNVDIVLAAGTVELDHVFGQENKSDLASMSSQELATQKSPSIVKTSSPLCANIDKMNDNALPKLNQRLKKQTTPEDSEESYEDSYDFSEYTSEATANFLDSSENEKNPYARSYFIRKQRFSVKENRTHVGQVLEDGDNEDDCSDIQQLIIKEEYIESAVCEDSPESPSILKSEPFDLLPLSEVEHKRCPYCPAVFESGVGLSNHVRGHLHRVGLSYNARHMVSPEQVALQDRQPRIRKRVPSGMRRIKKADKPESQGEHICPLCWGWFDTKTGLSNHVRGHLKRIGKTVTSNNKSPVCFLNELLQDQKEYQNILQTLNRKQFPSRPFVSQKLISTDGLFLMRTGIPVKIQYDIRNPTPTGGCVPKLEGEEFLETKKPQVETQGANEPASSTLVELLKTRQKVVELKERDGSYADRKHFNMTKESMEETQLTSVESNWAHGDCDSDKICVHCNTTFPTAVSLSNHLRVYAHRKKIAILERTRYDFKQKRPRARPGLKKKVLPPLDAVEEIYRLTCRFCDLVFQGPLSVQEDWIKHLQRHLMHTGVPHSGTGMVEVLGLHQEGHDMSYKYPSLEQNTSSLELPVAS
ncbi:zinc finger protein 644 [Polymixia lowei]